MRRQRIVKCGCVRTCSASPLPAGRVSASSTWDSQAGSHHSPFTLRLGGEGGEVVSSEWWGCVEWVVVRECGLVSHGILACCH